jgi:hypothetical protein
MTVRIQSGTTVTVNSGQTVRTPQVQNAGTIRNAGTTQQFRSNVASGSGSGLGTARTSPVPFPRASGTGQATGSAIKQVKASVIASGIGKGIGSAVRPIQGLISASGSGSGFGTAVTPQTEQLTVASGTGKATGSAVRSSQKSTVATGIGQATGNAITKNRRSSSASGFGEAFGTAQAQEVRFRTASGIGDMLGTARKPIPFDPIQQIVNLINKTNDSRWRYGKPERIAPIWEYSHNDRINFPNPAFYIYTPAESTVDKFGIEGESFNQTITIEILIMTLEATETQGYVGDTAEFITQLYNDNTQNTVQFHRFGNITASDLRNEHMGQQTDHYLASVTFEIQRFNSIRDLESVGAFR